ncbi:Sec34-like family protein [Drepanopeziza brunnea f. sp. 'multigermtubi' MB_m1]|uniref:Conserved oligomeric Golgi complex subunit 3 n=1 Tax=Marssonina brunnea f. sp. multigermtubi (strain MB_m1) TaxID=1072389 RepID=K1WMY6_MARBU|nr:Sec34-like family protein [Drepanopeziza brunnea f. sp. 'multigermtubi' MB_m1]EKD14221.1 Sec34-like family protein [Drepanopeziza brunnea f. sp. 'multigermtubi' MB_m1]
MYDGPWYSFVPDSQSKKDDAASQASKHRRRESLLKQPDGQNKASDLPDPILELYEDTAGLKGPPVATLAKRAKSYSDFYDVAVSYLGKESMKETPKDSFGPSENVIDTRVLGSSFEDFEDELLVESQEDYRLYRDQLILSERHLDTLLSDTTAALDLLASLSESFVTVESETTAFQGQCEDLLAEQKRLRDLADEVGTDLQYYAYLEPLTRRLNAPGSGRLVRNDDFLEMLLNLNTCIDFMDQHPSYRDSTVYKTRYTTLLERALDLVQVSFSSALHDVSDGVSRELKAKEHNETAEYILLYGKYETVYENFGLPVQKLLKSAEFAFGQKGDDKASSPYVHQYHELFNQLIDAFLKSREPVGTMVTKNLKKFATKEKPDTDFEHFARLCVQHVLDICHNEQKLVTQFFQDGPLLADYQPIEAYTKSSEYAGRLENNILSHLETLHTFLLPYLSSGDLQRICDLVNWLETMYMASNDDDLDDDQLGDSRRSIAQALLSKYLWKSLDSLFLKAATEIEHFKPTQEDLRVTAKAKIITNETTKAANGEGPDGVQVHGSHAPLVSNSYPTVKTAVKLLVMYNEGVYDRPRTSDVLYEIVHQVTESLQKAATIIKRSSNIMDAQLFLIRNLMFIENLFMTQEIPDVIRQSAELDFSPIWDTIQQLQDRKQLFNPLAYITPLVKGNLLPAVVDRVFDARKELEKVLVQQITAFTKTWQARLAEKDIKKRALIARELEILLERAFDEETTRAALLKMIQTDDNDPN